MISSLVLFAAMVCPLTVVVFTTLVCTAVGTTPAAKKSRNQLTVEQKVWLIERRESHKETYEQLARSFDTHFKVNYALSKTTISTILKNADTLKAASECKCLIFSSCACLCDVLLRGGTWN